MGIRNQQGFITMAVITILALVALSGAGIVALSQITVPGDRLYPIKTMTEDARLALSFDEEAKIKTQLAIAEEKLNEIEKLSTRGINGRKITEAAHHYGEWISAAAQTAADVAQSKEEIDLALVGLVIKATSVHLTSLANVYEIVPDQAKPAIERAIRDSTRGREEVLNAIQDEKHVLDPSQEE